MTTPLVHICNAKSFGPAAAQRLVELHQRQMLVAHGVAQADLGVEIAPLGVQHVDVIGASGTVLQMRQFDVFARRIAQIQLQGRRFAGAAIGDHSVVGLLEDRQDFLLVGQTRFVVGRQRGAVAGLLAAETEDRRSERPGDIRERRTEKSAQGVVFETFLIILI